MTFLLWVVIVLNLVIIVECATSDIWRTARSDVDTVKNLLASTITCSFVVIVVGIHNLQDGGAQVGLYAPIIALFYSLLMKQVTHIIASRRIHKSENPHHAATS